MSGNDYDAAGAGGRLGLDRGGRRRSELLIRRTLRSPEAAASQRWTTDSAKEMSASALRRVDVNSEPLTARNP